MNVAAPNPKLKHKLPPPSADERLNDLERRRELGQFFTPTTVAGFMWDFLEIIHGGKFPVNTRLIDPACGDGVFLRVANEHGRLDAERLYGTDIDETLVPTWRRDRLLGSAHLHLVNGLVDEPALGIREGTFDVVASNRLSPLRHWLMERMDILATVSLPQKVFTGVGANAKTTILFARRLRRERADGWWLEGAEDKSDADRLVLLAAPRLDSPNWSLDKYLEGVLESARNRDFRSSER